MILSSSYSNRESTKLELEMLFEISKNQVSRLHGDAKWITNMLAGHSDMTAVRLDQQRNSLMKANLHLSMGTFSAACFVALTGAFGMNLTTGLEEHPQMFTNIVAAGGVS